MARKDDTRTTETPHEAEKEADAHREEVGERNVRRSEGAREMGKDALRKMTEGQDQDDDEGDTIEQVAGPMHVSERRQLTRSDSAPEDAEPEPFPVATGEGT